MSHVGVHFGSMADAGGAGGGGGTGGGGEGDGGGHGVSPIREYTTQSMFGTVSLQSTLWLIQCMLDGPGRPELQSARTSKEEQPDVPLQLLLPYCTHFAAVAPVHMPLDRAEPAEQLQCAATQPEVETQDPLTRA